MTDINKSEQGGASSETASGSPDSTASAAIAEPFECPNCGQMLGPGSTVCAACRQTVDFAKVRAAVIAPVSTPATASSQPEEPQAQLPIGKNQFSLPIFVASVLIYLTVVGAAASVLTITHFRYFLAGVLIGCTAWVIFDAHARRVPHPLRWGLGTLFIWVVVFPWYLSRRRTPEAPCPIMDAQGRFFARTVLFVFVLCGILYCLLAVVLHKPPK